MTTTRRGFLKTSLAGGAALAFANVPAAFGGIRAVRLPSAPLRILILGGTQFLGPACMEVARARGHKITLFNRGRIETRKHMQMPADVEVLYGNRDPNKSADEWREDKSDDSPKGLTQLEGKEWDAVIDTSGFYPRMVKASAELLAPKVKQYLFISTVSVYADGSKPGSDETAELAKMEDDPTVENMGPGMRNYGPLKVLCEQAAEAAMPGRTTIVRPGFIVGPGDPTDRFTYWPLRIADAKGDRKEVLCPGTPKDPIQLVDVRDLADFLVLLIERNTIGTFDALGPQGGIEMGAMLETCARVSKTEPTYTWVPTEFLEANQVSPGGDMPIWVPPTGESAGFHTRNVARAAGAGLKFRPIQETIEATLAWWPGEVKLRHQLKQQATEEATAKGRPAPNFPDPDKPRAGISAEREQEVLAKWRGKGASTKPEAEPATEPKPS